MLTLDLLSMSLVCIIASDVLMRGAVASSNMCDCAHRFPILMELYHSANGSLWSANSGWGSPATECSQDWYGVDCTGNDVRSVNLAGNNLIGSLPPSWGNLTGLSSLYLHSNQLSGSLPESWGSLSSLQTLTLYNNSIRGSLPLSWGGMAAIIDLHLYANNIEGGLPDDWASLGATLTTLFLFSNKIDGTLPASWHNMTNLKNIQLQLNGLSGSLPSAWSSMSSLEILNLYGNTLTGSLPDAWGNMSNMMAMYVKGNYLSGTLPESWSSLWKITDFQLNYNNLVGTLPSSWSSMTELTLLTMHYNSLTGTLPSSWGHTMVKLTRLSLQNNQLNGTIPESWVTGMTALRQLYLSFNELSGTIPSVSWSAMTNLATLHIESNQLVGTLPPSLGALGATSMLKQLFLQDNCLSGMIATGSYSTFAAVAVSSDADGMNTCSTRLRRTPSTVSVCGGDAKSTWPAFCFWIVSRSSSITTATSSLTRNVSKSVSGSQSRRRNTDTASISTSSSTSSSASGSRTTTPSSSSTSTPPTSTSTHDSSATTHDSSGTAMSLSFSHSWPQSQTVNTHTKSTTSGRDKSMTSSQWHSTTSPSDLEATTPHSTTASTTSLLNSSHTLAMPTLTCFPNLGSTVTMSLATTTSLTHDGSGDEVVALISSVNIFQHTIANSDGGVPLSVEFTALPVARATLVDLPKFVLNISKHDRFSTMSSTMFWRTSGVVHVASSLLSTNLNWSTVEVGESTTTEEVEGGEGGASWQVLRVSPPTSGWLDAATTSPVLDRTVSLVVTMACAASDQAVNNTVARISISIPAPGVARQLASEVKAAGGYSQKKKSVCGGDAKSTWPAFCFW
ncbi:GP46-like surface antigen, putative, partial [Bodo saltans]